MKHSVDPDPVAAGHVQAAVRRILRAAPRGGHDPRRYDLVFVDGLHIADQVERDIVNSLAALAPGGMVVLHDCNPKSRKAARRRLHAPRPLERVGVEGVGRSCGRRAPICSCASSTWMKAAASSGVVRSHRCRCRRSTTRRWTTTTWPPPPRSAQHGLAGRVPRARGLTRSQPRLGFRRSMARSTSRSAVDAISPGERQEHHRAARPPARCREPDRCRRARDRARARSR